MNFLNLLLAAIIIYIPYQQHFPLVLDLKGLNLINMLFLLVVLIIAAQDSLRKSPAPLKWHFMFFFFALAVSLLIGQVYDSSQMASDATALKTDIFYMLFYFLYYHAARDVRSIRFLFGVVLLVALLVSFHAIRQALDYGTVVYSDTRRASGPFAPDYRGANVAAAFFIIFVPMFFSVFLLYKSKPLYRMIALACSVVGIMAAFFTFSRQAYFILAALFFLQATRRNILLGILLGIVVLSYEAWAPSTVIERISMTEETDAKGEQKLDKSTESRFIIWEGAKQLIIERPWGIGLSHFPREIGRYVTEYENFDAHNGYVLVLTETGFLGLFTLLLLFWGLLRLGFRVTKLDASEDSRLFGYTFVVAVIGAALTNVFGSRIFNGEVMGNFWIFAGLVARYYTLTLEQRQALSETGISPMNSQT